jgi:hypothetical protein
MQASGFNMCSDDVGGIIYWTVISGTVFALQANAKNHCTTFTFIATKHTKILGKKTQQYLLHLLGVEVGWGITHMLCSLKNKKTTNKNKLGCVTGNNVAIVGDVRIAPVYNLWEQSTVTGHLSSLFK